MKSILLNILTVLLFFNCSSNLGIETKITSLDKLGPEIELSFKVDSIFHIMTITEKLGQLNLIRSGASVKTGEAVSSNVKEKIKTGLVGGIFGLQGKNKILIAQEMAVNDSRLGIPLIFGLDVIHGYKTTFPIPIALSCSWDMNLIEKVARASAEEATSDGINWTFSPMVDIARDPRWGRIAEGGGEDTYLGGCIARAMVHGYQGNNLSETNTMMSCVKHFANYGAAEGGRDYATVDMSRIRSLNEYLPPYKEAISAGVGSVMTSFNVLEYVPASASEYYYQDILRSDWKFDGIVVTDYTAINEMVNHGIGNLQEVSQRALNVGIDMDMVGEGFLTTLENSIIDKKVNINQIDQACRRILKSKELLGLFENPYLYLSATPNLLSKPTRNLARYAASESFVLLKNENNILPLKKDTKIALIGPLVNSRRNMLGCWSVAGDHDAPVTVLEGVENIVNTSNLLYAKGCNITDDSILADRVNAFGIEIDIDKRSPKELIDEALTIALKSDVVIAVMGEAADMTGEASSMSYIGLQPSQQLLLRKLKETGKPIILILFNGRPMTLEWEAQQMDAILDVWFGGTESGNAISDVIFGAVNPSGKLTTSFPINVGQIPVYHSMLNTGRPNNKSQKKFRSNYLDIPNEPLYPFGYGLSYTDFEYGPINLNDSLLNDNNSITANIAIKNIGDRKGKEIIQMYIRDVEASISRPMKELKGFEKIELIPGQSKIVEFKITEEMLRFYNSNLVSDSESGDFELFIGRNSQDTKMVKFKLEK